MMNIYFLLQISSLQYHMSQQKKQNKRIRYCVLICESLYHDFDSASAFLDIANFSAIDYTINWLIQNDIEEIFLFYSQSKEQIQNYYNMHHNTLSVKMHLHFMKISQLKTQGLSLLSFGDVIRQVHFRDLISQDFLVMYSDNITNVNLGELINNHFDRKIQLKNVVLTTVMRRANSSQIFILNSATNEILQVQSQGNKEFELNTDKVNIKKINVDFRRDLVAVDMFICTIEVVKSFKETYQYTTMQDFIVGMLTSEVYEEKINAYILKPTEVSFRLNKGSSFYVAYMNFICGYLTPYSIYKDARMSKFQKGTDKLFTVQKYNKIFKKNVKISDNCTISNNCYIGQSTKIEANCIIDRSIISKNCVISKNVHLKNCIVLEDCLINQNISFQYCLIQKVDQTLKIHSFKAQMSQQFQRLIDRELFLETPECEEVTIQEELRQILKDKPQEETILVSQLTRIRREFNKNQKHFTAQIIKSLKPQGLKGIQNLVSQWGSVLLKIHHDQESDLITSLFYSCVQLQTYNKAFHLLLQYFYHYQILQKQSIILWYKQAQSQAITFTLCKAFIQKLQTQSDEQQQQQDQNDEQQTN